ncbi:MAG: deoxyribodipyrimidine photo-lyase [Lautropia sp.]
MPSPLLDSALVWFRRDLRVADHAALAAALTAAQRVHCAFVFDRTLLDPLAGRADRRGAAAGVDRRVAFIHGAVTALRRRLRQLGGDLIIVHDHAAAAIPALAARLGAAAVFAGRDYEPTAVARDTAVAAALAAAGRRLELVKDQVILERDQLLTGSGAPFRVFTPYRRAWLARVAAEPALTAPQQGPTAPLAAAAAVGHAAATAEAADTGDGAIPSLAALGFAPVDLDALGIVASEDGAARRLADFAGRIRDYDVQRDFPGVRGVSYLSVHLRFGTVSIREAVRLALGHGALEDPRWGAATWLGELIWRDFFFQILHHHPQVVDRAFRPEYDRVAWESDATVRDARLAAWCQGRTGYPLVDAAMHQINRTGYMHNRLRMLVASFFSKHLGLDWRLGERYFAEQLIDYDQAANNGGWQWAASTGCDAQPYFRIFNPVTQSRRFDPNGAFIRRYLPDLARLPDAAIHAPWTASAETLAGAGIRLGRDYPEPIVDHAAARAQALARYAAALGR